MSLPLQGRRVFITRPGHQSGSLVEAVQSLGGHPVVMPAIAIVPVQEVGGLDQALRGLSGFGWVVFTSSNGVTSTLARMAAIGVPTAHLAERRLACVGPATAAALAGAVRVPDAVPQEHVSDAMAAAMGDVRGGSVLFLRAESGREVMPAMLRELGAEVLEVAVYRTAPVPADELAAQIAQAAAEPGAGGDIVTLASPSAARSFLGAAELAGCRDWARSAPIACIGPVTARAVEALGYAPACVAETYTSEGLARALAALGSLEQDERRV